MAFVVSGTAPKSDLFRPALHLFTGLRLMSTLHKTGVLLGMAFLLGLAACREPASQPEPAPPTAYAPGDSIQVAGVLVDTRCFHLDREANRHDDHVRPEGRIAACARACAGQGIPVALLEDGAPQGRVWFLGGYPSQLYAGYMAGTVRVEGEVRSKGVILPSKVEYKDGDTWKRIL